MKLRTSSLIFSCFRLARVAGADIMFSDCPFVLPSVRPSVCLFVCYKTCKHDFSKTNERISTQIGTSGLLDKDM